MNTHCHDMLWERSIITVEDVTTCIQSMRIERGDTHEGAGEELGQMIVGQDSWVRVVGFYFARFYS